VAANPAIQGSISTPWEGLTYGGLVERCLNAVGLTNSAYAGTDTNLPAASAGDLARMQELVKDGVTHMLAVAERVWPISETDLAASADYQGVTLPADFGGLVENGVSIQGRVLSPITTEGYLSSQRTTEDGGGTLLTGTSGDPVWYRMIVVHQTDDSVRQRLGLYVYPLQTAAYTVHLVYRATASALDEDSDVIRLPVLVIPHLRRWVNAAWAEFVLRDFSSAAALWALYRDGLVEIGDWVNDDDVRPIVTQAYPDTTVTNQRGWIR
jgi:hypothetical protein